MGARHKGRHNIVVGGESFVYWVADDDEAPFGAATAALNVVSEDATFAVRYRLDQPDARRHLTVIGSRFRDRTEVSSRRRHFRCPAWGHGGEDVAALVRFCLTGSDEALEVDERGDGLLLGSAADARLWARTREVLELLAAGELDQLMVLSHGRGLGADHIRRVLTRHRRRLVVPGSVADARFSVVGIKDAIGPMWSVQCDVGDLTLELTLRESESGALAVEIDDLVAL
jgi:hypothetical protein